MANTTISQLTPLTGTAVANDDSFLIYDASANTEKQIVASELKNMVGNGTFTITTSSANDALVVTSTDTGATGAPDIIFFRNSDSPAASDAIGNIIFRGKSSTGVNRDYAGIYTAITSPTNAAETGSMAFHTINTGTLAERMRITATGNVGVGTSSPVQSLTIQRSAIVDNGIALNINNPYGYGTGNTAAVGIRFNRTPNDSGTTGVMADIYGGNENPSSSTAGYLAFATRTGLSEVTLEHMRISSAGNVGIGITSPTSKLHVSGNAAITSTLSVTGNITGGAQIVGKYTALSNGTTAMALATNAVVKVTPTATATYTTTVAPAGSRASVIIVTSGTTSYTITFGTGFKTTGTLATGTTTARTFAIDFVSDGTSMIETSRTAAMA